MWNWHLSYLCEWLECVTFGLLDGEAVAFGPHKGEIVRNLLVNEPPRNMKSILISVMWPVWEWTLAPHMRYLTASYADRLSTDLSLSRRRIIESEWYERGMRHYWGHEGFALTGDQNVKTSYENTSRGKMIATTFGSTAIGEGGDRIIVDDPQNPGNAYSEVKRLNTLRYWDGQLSTRLNDKKTGAYVVVMQRLHQRDLTGHVLDEPGWCHVCIPAIAEHDESIVFPRSGRVVKRKTGGLLWPEREGEAELATLRTRLGSHGFAGQYQQRPTALEGGMVKRAWVKFWTTRLQSDDDPSEVVLLPEGLSGHRQSWDMGLWGKSRDDYTVGGVGARIGANVYLLDLDRRRLDLPGMMAAMRDMTDRNPEAVRKVVEAAAAGPEVKRRLNDSVAGIVTKPARGDKEARLAGVSPMIEAGNFFIPHPRECGWASDLLEELVTFPFADHDDQVDMISQMLQDFLDDGVSEAPASGGHRVTATPGHTPASEAPGIGRSTSARRR